MANMLRIRNPKHYRERRNPDQKHFKKLYRFSDDNLQWISEHFLGEANETRGGAISAFDKMRIFTRYASDPGFQVGVGEDIGVHQSTVSKVIPKVMEAIFAKKDRWIRFPQTLAEVTNAKLKWLGRYKLSCVIGAVDCTHVRIEKPSLHGDDYVGRKAYPSFNVQATVDADEWFTSVDPSWPGSTHDSRIWKNSTIGVFCSKSAERLNFVILGDEGYGCTPWLLVPYRNPVGDEIDFNRQHSRERVLIERVFGQLKRRFPQLGYKVRLSTDKISKFIICCCILHNVAQYLKDGDDFEDCFLIPQPVMLPPTDEEDESEARIRRRGLIKRDSVKAVLVARLNETPLPSN